MDGGRNNGRRGAGNSGGSGRGPGSGGYHNKGSDGRGTSAPHLGHHHQSPVQQHVVNRSPAQGGSQPPQQAWVNPSPAHGAQPPKQARVNRSPAQVRSQTPQQACVNRSPAQGGSQPPQQAGFNRSSAQGHNGGNQHPGGHAPPRQIAGPVNVWRGSTTGNPWGRSSAPSPLPVQPRPYSLPPGELDMGSLKISSEKPPSPPLNSKENQIQPIRRPDRGGTLVVRHVKLIVNHFPVKFDPDTSIIHYDVDVKPIPANENAVVKKKLMKSDRRFIRDKLFSDNPKRFPILQSVYDGDKNIFSAVRLPTGQFEVEVSDGESVKKGSYMLAIKFVNELALSKLKDYLRGSLSYIPRDILQGMDLVMKENPSRQRICAGRAYFSSVHRSGDDLRGGVAAYRGFKQSLKTTSLGLVCCLDYCVIALHKPMAVIDFLLERIPHVKSVNDINSNKRLVFEALRGLKVNVIHRPCKQKFTIAKLADEDTRDSHFVLIDREGNDPPRDIRLVTYYKEKWGKDIKYLNIPCLELGKSNSKLDKVPMEYCVLVEGQRYPKENLDRDSGRHLKSLSLPKPWVRKDAINEMLQADDGPCGAVSRNFGFEVDLNMTRVSGRVMAPPELKLGGSESVKVDAEKGQWNLVGRKSLVDAKPLERWALLDFTGGERFQLQAEPFVHNLMDRSRNLGMCVEKPLLYRLEKMSELSSADKLAKLLDSVVRDAGRKSAGKLQLIVCGMSRRVDGYKTLKWVSETQIGVLTQCCLSENVNSGKDQNLANLCLKINAKLGGSNFELGKELPHFGRQDHVMFIGADVNHPAPNNTSCPSIAAVVGTVNWPAANRYAARVSPQRHREEKISNFGNICRDLVNTYASQSKNNLKPSSIVVFRDGVSEGQFEIVLNKELLDLKNSVCDSHYQPKITVIVAIKRHQTRLFVENRNDGGQSGNVPPGTVVDSMIVVQSTSTSIFAATMEVLARASRLIITAFGTRIHSPLMSCRSSSMICATHRCTKSVSLVPPVYYADIVAYRGRMFQEAAMSAHSGAPRSHLPASTSNPPDPFLDQSFYSLHRDLENVMFFI